MKRYLKGLKSSVLIASFVFIILSVIGCGGGGSAGSSGVVSSESSELSDISSNESSDNSTFSSGENSDAAFTESSDNPFTGTITLAWDAPATNEDGSDLTDLAGYKVHYGTLSGNYTESVDIGSNTGAAISSLTPGTWCFSVSAYDTAGNESEYSEEVCQTI